MLIAHVSFAVRPDVVDTALEVLLAETPDIRAMPGCIAFVPFRDLAEPNRIGIEWQRPQAFAAYTASTAFAASGLALRPLMTTPPISKRFDG